MAKRTNPLDTEAAKPVDFTEANEAREFAKTDSDRILAEMNDRVNRMIAQIEAGAILAASIVDLVGKIVPLVTRTTPTEGDGYVSSIQTKLADLKALACKLTGTCK